MDKERTKKGRKRKLTESQLIINELEMKAAWAREQDNRNAADDIIKCKPTVSIALPGSILSTVPTDELKTYVIGQVARAAALFKVDELIIFDEMSANPQSLSTRDVNSMFANVLQYLETPQYLRRVLFPKHPDLQHVGLLHPLNCSHHMKQDEWSEYRDGVVLDRPSKRKSGSYVNVGLIKDVRVDICLQPGVRVTVKMQECDASSEERKNYRGSVVSPLEPSVHGLYWGYSVRYAKSFSSVFSDYPYGEKYDLVIGTSDKGENISDINFNDKFKHCLIVFGGLAGLETCLEGDEELKVDVRMLFDYYLNCCPRQGCKTIRTEEAILITLSSLQGKLL